MCYYYFFTPVLNSQGGKNDAMQYRKVQKSSWNEPYSSSSFIIIIMQRLTRHVSVIRMTNRRRGGHVDLRVAVSVIKRFELVSF